MSNEKFWAIASTDETTAEDGFSSLVLQIRITEDEVLALLDTKWYDELARLTAKYGGVAINTRELRAGYNPKPKASSNYDKVAEKVKEKFYFRNSS